MRLYTIDNVQKNNYYKVQFSPQAGIILKWVKNVPCLSFSDGYAIGHAMSQAGINRENHIIPVVLQQSTIGELKNIENTEKAKQINIYDCTIHKNDKGVIFLKEQNLSQDKDIIVLLELPVNDAQPHYKFSGGIEILLSIYTTYYDPNLNSFSQNQLYVAIVKMNHGSKLEFTYSSPYSQDITIPTLQNLMKYKFEYICHEGGLYYINDYREKFYFKKADEKIFLDLYSEFSTDI